MRTHEEDEIFWPVLASVVLMVVAVSGRKGAEKAWRSSLNRPVPQQPDAPIKDALLWAVVSGVSVACLRILALRGLNRVKAKYIEADDR